MGMMIKRPRWTGLAKPILNLTLCCAAALSLQACIGVVVGGAVMGTFAATDRRTFGAQTEDQAIMLKGENRLSSTFGNAAHINVNSFNRRVLLTGEVADEQAKSNAEKQLQGVDGVAAVINELQLSIPSSLAARSNDALITTKVKASLVDTKDIYASAFKVVTEESVVYLMGRVTQREANAATEVARGVSGVKKVVKVFEYISEDDLKAMLASPNKKPEEQ
jgi:osmotically-inducible protein OsmY